MKKYILFFALAFIVGAQSLSLTIPPNPIHPGQSTTATVNYQDATTPSNMDGVQWLMTVPSSVTVGLGTIVGTTQTLACNVLLCIAYTPTAIAMTPGAVATFSISVNPGTPQGIQTVALTNIIGANTSGNKTADITNASAAITVLSRFDLNSDGKVDKLDTSAALDQILGRAPCALGDVNGDGQCNVLDLMSVILAVNGRLPL